MVSENIEIRTGKLLDILLCFELDSIATLQEINSYRLHPGLTESEEEKKHKRDSKLEKTIYHQAFVRGKTEKRRKVDNIRFNKFVSIDSANYHDEGSNLTPKLYLRGYKTHFILNDIKKAYDIHQQGKDFIIDSSFYNAANNPEENKHTEIDLYGLKLKEFSKETSGFKVSTSNIASKNEYQMRVIKKTFGESDYKDNLKQLSDKEVKEIVYVFLNPKYIYNMQLQNKLLSKLCTVSEFGKSIIISFADNVDNHEVGLVGKLKTNNEKPNYHPAKKEFLIDHHLHPDSILDVNI